MLKAEDEGAKTTNLHPAQHKEDNDTRQERNAYGPQIRGK